MDASAATPAMNMMQVRVGTLKPSQKKKGITEGRILIFFRELVW